MVYKAGDIVRWDDENGILKQSYRYMVDQVRFGKRGAEFTLKKLDGAVIRPFTWWEAGPPFIRQRKEEKSMTRVRDLEALVVKIAG